MRELNFTRAAECCHVAQPSLTRALKADHPGVVARALVGTEIWREVALVTVRGRPHSPGVGALMQEAMHVSWVGRPALAVAAARASIGM